MLHVLVYQQHDLLIYFPSKNYVLNNKNLNPKKGKTIYFLKEINVHFLKDCWGFRRIFDENKNNFRQSV